MTSTGARKHERSCPDTVDISKPHLRRRWLRGTGTVGGRVGAAGESTRSWHREFKESLAGRRPLVRVNALRTRRFARAMGEDTHLALESHFAFRLVALDKAGQGTRLGCFPAWPRRSKAIWSARSVWSENTGSWRGRALQAPPGRTARRSRPGCLPRGGRRFARTRRRDTKQWRVPQHRGHSRRPLDRQSAMSTAPDATVDRPVHWARPRDRSHAA